jgi:hypothetical protein
MLLSASFSTAVGRPIESSDDFLPKHDQYMEAYNELLQFKDTLFPYYHEPDELVLHLALHLLFFAMDDRGQWAWGALISAGPKQGLKILSGIYSFPRWSSGAFLTLTKDSVEKAVSISWNAMDKALRGFWHVSHAYRVHLRRPSLVY